MTLQEAEKFARQGNINGVAAFIQEHKSEYDSVTIQVMKETLLQSYLDKNRDREMDQYIFSDIDRITNL